AISTNFSVSVGSALPASDQVTSQFVEKKRRKFMHQPNISNFVRPIILVKPAALIALESNNSCSSNKTNPF
ncbi:hypothetical protein ACP3WD_25170, partial [Salmonella enterica]|uniref:hypothetical protein n=1 Tax=Salmonella enterica TaxID=28901 RepID=UPI003CF1C8B6